MPINKHWHESHRMPRNATAQQRISWHLEHARNCVCRPIPPKLLEEINRRQTKKEEGP